MSSSAMRFFPNAGATAQAAPQGSLGNALDLTEVNQAGHEVTVLDFEIQQLNAMASGIGNLIDVAGSVNGENGFSEQTFAVIEGQARHIVEGTGLDPVSVNMQSFDSDDNSSASSVCMLSLSSTAKNIWEAIIKAIKDMYAKITQWFAKITNKVPALIKKFEKLRDEAGKKTAGLKDDSDKITLPASVVKALGDGKSPKVTPEAINDISNALKEAAKIAKASTKTDKEQHAKILTVVKGISVDSNKSLITTLADMSDVFVGAVDAKTDIHDDEGVNTAENKKLGLPEFSNVTPLGFANKAVILKLFTDGKASKTLEGLVKTFKRQPDVDSDMLAGIERVLNESLKDSKLSLVIGDAIPDIEDAESQEIKTFTSSDVADICTDVIEALTLLKTFKEDHEKASREINKFTGEIIKAADKIENAKVDAKLNKAKTLTSKVVKSFADLTQGFAQFPPQVASLIVSTSNAIYAVGSQSVSAHK